MNANESMPRQSWILAAAFLVIGTSAAAQSTSAVSSRDSVATTVAVAPEPQVLRPGDLVRLRIWREPELSGDYPVDEQGVVVFPLIGPRTVTDIAPDSLKRDLIEAYAVYLRNPSIDVVLLRRVNVLGAVARPGLYPVDPTMTVADVLALAGGTTPIGNPNEIQLIRDGRTITTRLSQRARLAELSVRSGDQFYVPERSWIARNSNIVAALITATVGLIIAIAR